VHPSTRRVLDRSFSGLGILSIVLMAGALLVLLGPIVVRGSGAFLFRGTIEFRRLQLERFERGDEAALGRELAAAQAARQPVYDALAAFDRERAGMDPVRRREYRESLGELTGALHKLLGPFPGEPRPALPRELYGATRWDRARVALDHALTRESYDYSDPTRMGRKVRAPRAADFAGTALAPLFPYLEQHAAEMLRPRLTFYGRFLTDSSIDAHIFGGIWPELLGTLYLTLGAMLFALPMGILSAIYLVEYAGESRLISLLRTFVSTLAGVPSIVFGLFGLAFFVNGLHVTHGKSLLAGSLTLALLVLPTVIRASEEAIRAVPATYKEAALSVGASRWRAMVSVVLPASLPGVLTGIVISMGRAAGETAPIIFTAAVSVGKAVDFGRLQFWKAFSEPTPALPWNIYNLATEHEAVDEIRHVQFGMVLTLVLLVLLLNIAAITLRARITRRLHG
jgi:phosphate transport system permease protein